MSKSAISPQDEIWSLIKEAQKDMKELRAGHTEAKQKMKEIRAGHKEFQVGMKELQAAQKETDRQIKATFVDLSASQKDIRASHREARQEMKELRAAQKEFQAGMKELHVSQQELQKAQKETDKQLKKTDAQFNTQWGKLVESLVEGKLVDLLKARGIKVHQTSQRTEVSYREKNGELQRKEFDILVMNGTELVAVEVKTTLRPSDVSYFLEALKNFTKYFPLYKSHAVYGAVAYLRSGAKAHLFAERQGLFVIRATGDSASIINKESFKPKAFS